jgi:hypothetical protein
MSKKLKRALSDNGKESTNNMSIGKPHIKLEFVLENDHYGKNEAKRLLNATNAYLALQIISEELRRMYKYEDLDDKQAELVDKIRDRVNTIMEVNNVDMGDLD